MNKMAEVMVLVEGKTEKLFIREILAPYLNRQNVSLKATILNKLADDPERRNGEVKFAKAQTDIGAHLKQMKQRRDIWLTLLIDYYGIGYDWPGYEEAKKQNGHARKHQVICEATKQKICDLFAGQDAKRRFIPYVSMHEFEALLFSDPTELAKELGVGQSEIDGILNQFNREPEAINDSTTTAPSKRLESLCARFHKSFKKTVTGITIAEKIGIDAMRAACPLFDSWIKQLEALTA